MRRALLLLLFAVGCKPNDTPALAEYPSAPGIVFQDDLATIQLGETVMMIWDSWSRRFTETADPAGVCFRLAPGITLRVNGEPATVVQRGGRGSLELCNTVASAGPVTVSCNTYSHCERPLFRPAVPLSPDASVAELELSDETATFRATVEWPAAPMTATLTLPDGGVYQSSTRPGAGGPAVSATDQLEIRFFPPLDCASRVLLGSFEPDPILPAGEVLQTSLQRYASGPAMPVELMIGRVRCASRCEGFSKCSWGSLAPVNDGWSSAGSTPSGGRTGVQDVQFSLSYSP